LSNSMLKVLDLFSGIGGFSLGLERTGGFETVAFCEIEPFPRKVLAKHWPKVPCYDDVRTLTAARLAADGITGIDVITGGFPCQDISVAGKQAGIGEGTRSGLWSEIVRLVGELRPEYVIVENVANLLAGPSDKPGGWFGRILGDLAECGYDAEWENIPAAALGASHRRERIWIVGYANESGLKQQNNSEAELAIDALPPSSQPGILADTYNARLERRAKAGNLGSERTRIFELAQRCAHSVGTIWGAEPDVGRVAHGVPDRPHRIAALGNSVVPQIPELIGNAILASRQELAA
jgi:DNA (cytosine-5)-methyltransferase 1